MDQEGLKLENVRLEDDSTLYRLYSNVGRKTLLRIRILVTVWILLWSHKICDRDWKAGEALDILELTSMSIPQPSSYRVSYQSVLSESIKETVWSFTVSSLKNTFKSSIQKAYECLPLALKPSDPYWILSHKKQGSWVHLKNASFQSITCLKTEYFHLKSSLKLHLWKLAIIGVMNMQLNWIPGSHHRKAGQRSFLDKKLNLLKRKLSKPPLSSLVSMDDTILQGDGDKLSRWAEKFKEVVNCQVNARVVPSNILPIAPYPPAASNTLLFD